MNNLSVSRSINYNNDSNLDRKLNIGQIAVIIWSVVL